MYSYLKLFFEKRQLLIHYLAFVRTKLHPYVPLKFEDIFQSLHSKPE